MMAEVAYILMSTVNYLFATIAAAIIFLLHWFTRQYNKTGKLRKLISFGLPAVTIAGPPLYFFAQIFLFNSPILWFQIILLSSFIIPIILIVLANNMVSKIILDLSS